MASIAVIGGDGAGKSTIARMLLESSILPFRFLYMGINVGSSNVALPTSRLIEYVRRRKRPGDAASPATGHTRRPRKGRLRATLRLANRLGEEWFRQLLSWSYQLRGYVALYDRHFVFDFYLPEDSQLPERLSDRIHQWSLRRLYPKPDLVIFLDAPPEVLIARKGEATLDYHAARRRAFLELGDRTPDFVRVDATQPLEAVFAEVTAHIRRRFDC